MPHILKLSLLGATALSATIPATVSAQTAPVAVAAADSSGDIIVTARKKAESLQDVPVAITAYDSEAIKAARIENLADVGKLTAGLNYTPLFGMQNQLPIIRGAAQTLGQLNVGVFLDGIYLSGKAGVDLELNDLARVEVVKGPQSALYGRNTFAGAINYVTQRPSDKLAATAEVSGGGESYFKAAASVSGGLSDTIRVRVGGYYKSFDGFYNSGIDGGRVDFQKSYGGQGVVEWTPTPQLTATFRLSYTKDDDGQPPSSVITNNSAPGTPAGSTFPGFPAALIPSIQRNLLYIGNVPSIPENGVVVNTGCVPGLPGGCYGDREKTTRASGTLAYDFGAATLTSLTSYSYRAAEYTYDGDNTICSITGGCPNFGYPFAPKNPQGKSDYGLSSNIGYYRDISQELRLQSNGKQRFEWLVGAFYYNNHTNTTDRGITLPGALAITNYNSVAGSSVGAQAYRYPRTVLTTDSISVFASGTYHLTDKFGVTGELRYEHENQTFLQGQSVSDASITAAGFVPTGGNTPFNLAQSFHFWTPRVILNYKFSPDVLGYASYARGAKTGGFNTGLNVTAAQRTYQPEYSNNYELGLKTTLFNRVLTLNAAAYYDDWQDQQATCQNPVTSGGSSTNRSYLCNVAASEIYGLELEAVVRPSPYFALAANYTYTHARYKKFVDDSLAQTLALAGLPGLNFDGKSLPYVPDHKFVVSPTITIPGDQIKTELRADIVTQSKTFVRADNLQIFEGFTTVDLRATFRYGQAWLQLWANNVFDNATPVAGVRFFDSSNYSVSSPQVTGASRRLLGATLGFKY